MAFWNFGGGPGTHALVVGVGQYPHLVGGSGPLFAQHGGMGQLTSAPISARTFANWLATTYQDAANAAAPLSSLHLLLSEASPAIPYEPRPGAGARTVERATFDLFRRAVDEWVQRLNQSPQERGIFYFCGHGISAGLQTTLLLEDFGREHLSPFRHALDFTRFHLAMDRASARTQCFFVDACRLPASVSELSHDSYGDSILTPLNRRSTPPRKAPAFFAAMPGTAAYGRPGQTSLFTEALLRSLEGAGATRSGRAWTIQPTTLYRALERALEHSTRDSGSTQSCTVEHLVDFPLHVLNRPPNVPVSVECKSPIDLETAVIRVSGTAGNREQSPPVPSPWRFELPPGHYQFLAVPPEGTPHSREEPVYPPYMDIELP